MRKTREIYRLNHFGMSGRAIARAVGASNSTVSGALSRLKAAGLAWPDIEDMSEAELERRVYGEVDRITCDPREPDWKTLRTELAKHRYLTLQLAWAEYRLDHPDGYSYSWYCERYRAWLKKADPVMRQHHVFGEKLFVDWAGRTVPLIDADTGEVTDAHLFLAVLGASNFMYIEAFRNEETEAFLAGHVNAFEYMGGSSALLVPDNLKTGVSLVLRMDSLLVGIHVPLVSSVGKRSVAPGPCVVLGQARPTRFHGQGRKRPASAGTVSGIVCNGVRDRVECCPAWRGMGVRDRVEYAPDLTQCAWNP